MLELLTDIRRRLKAGDYKNEEHVRLSLVARVVQALGWDIWNPTEVYAEFKATPNEDVKRVDLALFADNLSEDAIFIECKGTGNLTKNLPDDLAKVERQLRDYNKDNTAQLAIITNGRVWRFYYCYTSGEFASKHFKTLNLAEDDLETVAEYFGLFLSKAAVADRSARLAAENYLNLTRKQQKMQDARPEAERRITLHPFPSLPDALVQVVAEQHTSLTRGEAEAFLEGREGHLPKPRPLQPVPPMPPTPPPPTAKPAKPAPVPKSTRRAKTPVAPAAAPAVAGREGSKNAGYVVAPAAVAPAAPVPADTPKGERFTLRQNGWQATAYLQPDGSLCVVAGSGAAAEATASLSAASAAARQQLLADGVLQPQGEQLVFTTDYVFNSANRAAEIIVARSVNGQLAWQHPSGRRVREFLPK